MQDKTLWILTFFLFSGIFLLLFVSVLRGCASYLGRYCRCVRLNKWCCFLRIDWQAYRRERESLRRFRELRQRHRDLLMRQELSTFSQIPGPIPDSILILQSNNVGFVIVPSTEGPRSARSQLTLDQRRKMLERLVSFKPYRQEDSINRPDENTETPDATTNRPSPATSSQISINEEITDNKFRNDLRENLSLAVPAHEEPENEISCAICLDEFVDGEEINEMSECSHFFHKDCLLGWLDQHDVCPCCRRVIVTEEQWKQAIEEEENTV
mmetsp:Transcript_26330/g.39884  ORF Transcript_26330/g.39884 Transcript_26330/m.39884 type:complete len:269 (+) Transcript_26330:184-990(+)